MTSQSTYSVRGAAEASSEPRKKDSTARFWDRVADGYAAKPVAEPEAYERKLSLTREFLSPRSEVLELGCGTGTTALHHAPHVRHIRATDVSGKMIEIARAKAASAGIENVEFACASTDEAYLPGAHYDAILALNLLHVVPNWKDVISDAYSRLQPGGVFVSSTLCLLDDHRWLRWAAPIGVLLRLMPKLSFFTGDELRTAITSAGFEIEHDWQASSRNGLFLVARRKP